MLVMRMIKDPPDDVSGFNGTNYSVLATLIDFDGDFAYTIMEKYNVQLASQVERGEPEGVAVEEHDEAYTKHDSDTIEEAVSAGHDDGELSSMEGEAGGAAMEGTLATEVECTDDGSDVDTESVATTTGHNDQEDTSEQPDLDIQFVKVITT